MAVGVMLQDPRRVGEARGRLMHRRGFLIGSNMSRLAAANVCEPLKTNENI